MYKLLKYEALAVGRVLVPVWLGAFALCLLAAGINALQSALPAATHLTVVMILQVVVELLAALSFLAVMAAAVIVNVQRFYAMLGTRGYLYFSLPVKPWQQIAAKLLCACGSTVLSVLALFLCGFVLGLGTADSTGVSSDFAPVRVDPDFSILRIDGQPIQLPISAIRLYLAALMLLMLAAGYLFFYLCIAIGAQWAQHRLAASVIAYFVLTFVLQFVGVVALLALALFYVSDIGIMVRDYQPSDAVLLFPFLSGILLLFVAANAILWIVTQHLISKKLNLG